MTFINKTTANKHKSLPALNNEAPEWYRLIVEDVANTGSIAATARRIGIDRSALSGFLNRTSSSPYINGKASTDRLAAKVLATIGKLVCPFLSQEYGEERRLTGLECRNYACIPNPPTQSPRAMQHWRACQRCAHMPKMLVRADSVKPVEKIASLVPVQGDIVARLTNDHVQQARIIDKVTLPLSISAHEESCLSIKEMKAVLNSANDASQVTA